MAEGVKVMSVSKLTLSALTLLAVTLIAAGAGLLAKPGWPTERPQEASKERQAPIPEPEPLEPLPKGALARFGSGRLQHGRPVTALRFTGDGQ
jgi:hypothetical protein